MDGESSLEDRSMSEQLEMVKDQMRMYQNLNSDLSKKVQEYKIALNATTLELTAVRNELMAEKIKTSEMRRTLNIINMQVTTFFNEYIKSIEKCVERTDIEISLVPQNGAGDQGTSAMNLPSRNPVQRPIDPDIPNVLHTILEESLAEDTFDRRASIPTSTPFVRGTMIHEGEENEEEPSTPRTTHSLTLASPSPVRFITSRSKRDFTLPTHTRQESPGEQLRVQSAEADDMSSENELDATTPCTSQQPNSRRQDIDNSTDSSPNNENLNGSNETFKSPESIFNLSVSKVPLKEARVNLIKVPTTPNTFNQFQKNFGTESAETEENQKVLSETDETQETSTLDDSAGSSVSLQTASLSMRKRKGSTEVPRRSTGRPKRTTRVNSSLAERKLKPKLRRS